jgi:nicotinamidase-related amidase
MDQAIDFHRSALIIMDFQPGILRILKDGREPLVERSSRLLSHARSAGVKIVYVNVGFRPGYPEVSPRNVRFSAIKQTQFLKPGPDCAPDPAIPPQPGDITMPKRRFSAFAGNDLEILLRSHDINTLILVGVSTSGCVLSTVRQAADADYRIVVVRDCCADGDMSMHEFLCDRVIPMQAEVITSMDFARAAEAFVDSKPQEVRQ